jgi:hypothetical protein
MQLIHHREITFARNAKRTINIMCDKSVDQNLRGRWHYSQFLILKNSHWDRDGDLVGPKINQSGVSDKPEYRKNHGSYSRRYCRLHPKARISRGAGRVSDFGFHYRPIAPWKNTEEH